MGRMLQLFFDGQSKFQFVDFESPDIYPIGWCKRTGHTLHSPFGPSKCLYVVFSVPYHWVLSLHMSQVAHQAEAYPVLFSMKQLGVFLLPPGRDATPSQGYPQH